MGSEIVARNVLVRGMEMLDTRWGAVGYWWLSLCLLGLVNVLAWSLSAASLKRRREALSQESYFACRRQLLLSAAYVFGCAFRSALPVFDVPRLVLVNSWLSSVIVGRSVATIAELCFVTQWALMLRTTARARGSLLTGVVSLCVVPLIAVAELCSWYSVLTTSNLGHVLEESIWGLSAALLVASLASIVPRCPPERRVALVGWCLGGVAYIAYMFLVDVPRYWSRWIADETSGRQYLSIGQGVLDVFKHRVVSYRWVDWKGEVIWMSLYFSVAVWISISLVRVAHRAVARPMSQPGASSASTPQPAARIPAPN
jgi:hypothetical protein